MFYRPEYGRSVALERRLEERERSASLVAALDGAARAIGDSLRFDEIFAAVGNTLRPLGISAHVLLRDGDFLTIEYIGAVPDALRRAEGIAGIAAGDYRLDIRRSHFHRKVLESRSALFTDDVVRVVRDATPESLAPVAPLLARVLRMKQMIGARLTADSVNGVLVLSSDKLTVRDTSAVSVLAHHVSSALRKVELVSRLQESLDALSAAQDQLVQSQKMEALGQLAGGVAHDLNNILTAVAVAADFLFEVVPSEGRGDLETIVDGTERAAALIRQLLAFGRRQLLSQHAGHLNEVVDSMWPLLERLVGEGMSLARDLEPRPRTARIDARQLEQVLLNLVVNARDASQRGQAIVVETRNVPAGESPPGLPEVDMVSLRVTDRGCGMDEETRSRIFDPFFTTKPVGRGTGLGLSVSYGIVRQHGGWMAAESTAGRGTTVSLFLPTCEGGETRPREPSKPSKPSKSATPRSLRVLLIEDDRGVRRALRAVLRRAGHEVVEAGSIQAARGVLRDTEVVTVDLVLTDVVLPDGSGPELVAEVFRKDPNLAVIVMTGYADEAAQRVLATLRSDSSRAVPLLHKPFTPDQLLAQVALVLP